MSPSCFLIHAYWFIWVKSNLSVLTTSRPHDFHVAHFHTSTDEKVYLEAHYPTFMFVFKSNLLHCFINAVWNTGWGRIWMLIPWQLMFCLQLAQGQGTSFSGCGWVKVFEFQTTQAGETSAAHQITLLGYRMKHPFWCLINHFKIHVSWSKS